MVLIFAKRNDPEAKKVSDLLQKQLDSKQIETQQVDNGDDKILAETVKRVKLGVVIGGDGTFLNLVKRLEKKDGFPLMGINLGTVGFITEFTTDEMSSAVGQALKGELREEARPLLKVELWRDEQCIESGMIFNDVVVNKDTRTSLAAMDVTVGGRELIHTRGDGYIVASATGSTGYALSAGGPLLHPFIKGLVLVPMCSHSLSARPVVVPEEMPIEITMAKFEGTAYLVCDGQVNLKIQEKDIVKISHSNTFLRLCRAPNRGWPDVLREKLQMN